MSEKTPTERGVLEEEMRRLMTPEALKELGEHLTPTVQQFMLRFSDLRDSRLGDELKKELKDVIDHSLIKFEDKFWIVFTEHLQNRNEGIINQLIKQTELLTEFKSEIIILRKDVNDLRCRVEELEKVVFK